ncbi:MAG: Hsp20/alpha crystallin family protein [bacterium]|nr:Hsp20/alpha crystallin family protein [bacterium]
MAEKKHEIKLSMWRVKDIDRLFERLYAMSPAVAAPYRRTFVPSADIFETEDELVFKLDLAGIDKENLTIVLENRILTVQGRRLEEMHEDTTYYYQIEIEYGHFRRVFDLPYYILAEEAQAVYREGFLYILMKKAEIETDVHTIIEIL